MHPKRGSTGPAPGSWGGLGRRPDSLQASGPVREVGVEQWPEHASSTGTPPPLDCGVIIGCAAGWQGPTGTGTSPLTCYDTLIPQMAPTSAPVLNHTAIQGEGDVTCCPTSGGPPPSSSSGNVITGTRPLPETQPPFAWS